MHGMEEPVWVSTFLDWILSNEAKKDFLFGSCMFTQANTLELINSGLVRSCCIQLCTRTREGQFCCTQQSQMRTLLENEIKLFSEGLHAALPMSIT